MPPNPVLRRLGLAESDRAVVLHADDIGMCQATLTALADLVEGGLISSAATMVPCPWFPAVAAYARGRASLDLGIHLTLTCEYTAYRWGPISTRDPASGLLDAEGYLHLGPGGVWAQGTAEAAAQEMAAQLERAQAFGVDVTHLDSHQLTVLHPRFVRSYLALAAWHRLPPFFLRLDAPGWQALLHSFDMPVAEDSAHLLARLAAELEEQGVPLFDAAAMLPLDRPDERVEQAKRALDALPPGLTHFVLHPAADAPELRAIADDWPSRVADYQAFASRELRDHVRRSGVQVIGYRALRELLGSN